MSKDAQYEAAKDAISEAAKVVAALDNSREKSLALTKLQEARMWVEEDRLRAHFAAGGF